MDGVNTDDFKTEKRKLSNAIYHAAVYFEVLENQGKIRGNGHHMAQAVCEFAEKLLEDRWISKK
jgi:hypothetical protein